MLLPLILLALATMMSAALAYGNDPSLAHWPHGLATIVLARRLEWPLVAIVLILCIALLALVISGRCRAWWLLGLAPILALFFHRFSPISPHRFYMIDEPTFVQSSPSIAANDWVVGLVFNDQAYALPYSELFRSPIVFITDYDKRVVVLWSAYANRAVAFNVARELKARDLEILCNPLDTILIHDQRLGQFICGLTGKTLAGKKPVGFLAPITTEKTTWANWSHEHPASKLLNATITGPAAPLLPPEAGKIVDGLPFESRVTMVDDAALLTDQIQSPLTNAIAGKIHLLLLRDATSHQLIAFDRNVKEDLFLTFTLKKSKKHPEAAMSDIDTNSSWTADGHAIDGPLKGSHLREVPLETDVCWGAMKYWEPGLRIAR